MNNFQIIGFRDIIALCLYALIYSIARKSIKKAIGLEFGLFEKGLAIWLIGNSLFFLLFYFYYGWGDTFNYYAYGIQLICYIFDYPSAFFNVYFSNEISQLSPISYSYYSFMPNLELLNNPANYFVVKITAIGLFFTMGSYLTLSFIFTLISFAGCWLIYSVFGNMYSPIRSYLYYGILLLPNLIFWGNGISKEALYLGGLGVLFYNFYQFFIIKNKNVYSFISILIGSYVIYSVKSYVFLCFFSTLILWYVLRYFYNPNFSIRKKSLIFFITTFVLLAISFFYDYSNIINIIAFNTILENALNYGNQVYDLSEFSDGSSYTLSEFEPTITGAIKIIPEAITTSLFRPYIWEIKKLINVFNAMEGIALMGLIVYLFIKIGFFSIFKTTIKSADILFCFIFSSIFLLGVSLSSFNFGALVRYKLPGELFFVIGLCILYYDGYLKPKLDEKNNIVHYH